jgi:AraC-like DNA-binding protein
MKLQPDHRCNVFVSPWPGVHGTCIDSARHYGRHWHATFGLGLVEQGAQRSASGLGIVDAYAGDLITTNPGEVHDGRPLDGPARRWRIVYLDPAVIASMTGDPAAGGSCLELTRPVIRDPALRQSLRQLFLRLDRWRDGEADALACEESLVQTCGQLLRRHGTAVPERDAGGDLGRVRDRLAADLLHPPTLTELAAMAGLSKYQLLRRFEKVCGMPPHAWLVVQRAERARGLIRQRAGIAEAAAACGFADQSHLTRVFVRQFGFTPGAWQRAQRPRPQ